MLTDSFQRQFSYLRLSVTELCNFRCLYCLPSGCGKPEQQALSVSEIRNLVQGFSELGISKVRLTGGEPTLRPDLLEIVQAVSGVPGVERVALTTNGQKILPLLPSLKAAGLDALNFSVDSLHDDRFAEITGKRCGPSVREAIEQALTLGFHVKLNAVLLRGMNDDELPGFLELIRMRPIDARFIELMQTGENSEFFKAHHLPARQIEERLLAEGWNKTSSAGSRASGPAAVFENPSYSGRVGLITPYSESFCSACNRLRVTARGALRLCLFGEGEYALRSLLQSPEQISDLKFAVEKVLSAKQQSHRLLEGQYGCTENLASIGG